VNKIQKRGQKVNNIRGMREANGFTQEAVARKLNIERSTIAKWETGKSLPRADKLIELSKIFKCTIENLLNDNQSTY